MGSEDGDDQDNYPDGNLSAFMKLLMTSDIWLLSGEEEEQELDAMMGELTNEELKAAFRSVRTPWPLLAIMTNLRVFEGFLMMWEKGSSVLRDSG